MTTETKAPNSLPTTLQEVSRELAQVAEQIEQLSERVGGLIVQVERNGDAASKAALAEAYAQLEEKRTQRRRLQDLHDEMHMNESRIHQAKRRAEMKARWEELPKEAEPLQQRRDAAVQAFEEASEGWLRAWAELQDVKKAVQSLHNEYVKVRKEVAPNSPGRLVDDVDVNALRALGTDIYPILSGLFSNRGLIRDGASRRLKAALEEADKGKKGKLRWPR